MKYSEINTDQRRAQADIMLNKFLELVNHYESEDEDRRGVRSTFGNFFLEEHQPHLEQVTRVGEFGFMMHLSNVDPFWDEGGPCELLGFFEVDWEDGQVTNTLTYLMMNFDTLTEWIWGPLPYPHNRHGFKWELGQ